MSTTEQLAMQIFKLLREHEGIRINLLLALRDKSESTRFLEVLRQLISTGRYDDANVK